MRSESPLYRHYEDVFFDSLNGIVLPQDIFKDETEEASRIYLMAAQERVRLYEGNLFVAPAYRPNLTEHILGLVKAFLSQEEVVEAFASNDPKTQYIRDFCTEVLFQIFSHDDEETQGEPQTFQQKCDPFLQIDAHDFKNRAPLLHYGLAVKYAMQDKLKTFLSVYEGVQKQWNASIADIADRRNGAYKIAMDNLFAQTLEKLEALNKTASVKFSVMQQEFAADKLARYATEHAKCEKIKQSETKWASGYLTKIFDKNDPFYVEHNREKLLDPDMQGALIERENSALTMKTIARSTEFLPDFMKSVANDRGLKAFGTMALRMTMNQVAEYALMAQPVVMFKTDDQKKEPHVSEARADFLELARLRMHALEQRRRTVSPLEDKVMMANDEIAAKAMTIKQFTKYAAFPLLNNNGKYGSDFAAAFAENLKIIRTDNPVKRHEDYRLIF